MICLHESRRFDDVLDVLVQQHPQDETTDGTGGVGPPGNDREIAITGMYEIVTDIWHYDYSYAKAAADFVSCDVVVLEYNKILLDNNKDA